MLTEHQDQAGVTWSVVVKNNRALKINTGDFTCQDHIQDWPLHTEPDTEVWTAKVTEPVDEDTLLRNPQRSESKVASQELEQGGLERPPRNWNKAASDGLSGAGTRRPRMASQELEQGGLEWPLRSWDKVASDGSSTCLTGARGASSFQSKKKIIYIINDKRKMRSNDDKTNFTDSRVKALNTFSSTRKGRCLGLSRGWDLIYTLFMEYLSANIYICRCDQLLNIWPNTRWACTGRMLSIMTAKHSSRIKHLGVQ